MAQRDPDRGYITWRPTAACTAKLDAVLQVLADYEEYLPVTLRQTFYILVARMVIAKTQNEYRKLAYILRKARRARIVPFESIHDQGSVLPHSLSGWSEPGDLATLVRHVVEGFDLDPQLGQIYRRVLWCEAAGMIAQLERVADPYGVPVISGGGYDSLTDKYAMARLAREVGVRFGQGVEVLHIGDLDPDGEDIFTALAEDAQAFADFPTTGSPYFTRLAVTREQVVGLGLPTKEDEMIVQAEAIPPDVLATLVDDALRSRLDLDRMSAVAEQSTAIRDRFRDGMWAAGLWRDA
jgi:hypothetical protein